MDGLGFVVVFALIGGALMEVVTRAVEGFFYRIGA